MSLVATESLVDTLLAEQRNLSAVERFSQKQSEGSEPAQAKYYRDLIPVRRPQTGQQYAFEVDLERCSGCKACVSACHSLNGLDEGESWRDIGTLTGVKDGVVTQQTVTSACHHCADPACANGCPTLAYEKDEETGIVRHLDDQCMGCRYCELKCPYQVPKYNERLGIVRKCDMCIGRLAEGEAPACVQACPDQAIRIRIVEKADVASGSDDYLLAGTVASDYTKPTTEFTNQPSSEEVAWADGEIVHPAHGHFPLVWMLVMTQAGAGVISFDWLARLFVSGHEGWGLLAVGVGFAMAGLAGSVFHLGRPLQGWRAFLGWRQSWLSREIIAFGAWSGVCFTYLGSVILPLPEFFAIVMGGMATLLGMIGVFCSVMVYVDTRRELWTLPATLFRFFGTAIGVGAVLFGFELVGGVTIAALVGYDYLLLKRKLPAAESTFRLLEGPLSKTVWFRLLSGALAILLSAVNPFLSVAFLLVSELAGRLLFFQAVDEPAMPGGFQVS